MSDGERVVLPSIDGLALDARVHRPAAAMPSDHRRVAGVVVLAHGIGADLDEGGMYGRLADQLAALGLGVVRFSFRGHGASAGTQRGVTIAGELLDVEAAIARARAEFSGPLTVLGSSFGAVAVLESASYLGPDRLVLWNPILDLRRTFIEPELPWGLANFGPDAWRRGMADGALLLDGTFEVGRALLTEFSRYRPGEVFAGGEAPTLIVHGELDSYVSYEIAQAAAQARRCDFRSVVGSDHGFDTREREDEAIAMTVAWITGSYRGDTPMGDR